MGVSNPSVTGTEATTMRQSHLRSFREQAGVLRRQFLQDGDLPFADVPWGDDYKPGPNERKRIEINRWYCLERRLKLNSVDPVKADGLEELWVDGDLVLRREGLRFRKVPEVRITVFELEVYYHGLPERYAEQSPAKVYYDHVVIARDRIGCLRPE
jgi:hypothetical protein